MLEMASLPAIISLLFIAHAHASSCSEPLRSFPDPASPQGVSPAFKPALITSADPLVGVELVRENGEPVPIQSTSRTLLPGTRRTFVVVTPAAPLLEGGTYSLLVHMERPTGRFVQAGRPIRILQLRAPGAQPVPPAAVQIALRTRPTEGEVALGSQFGYDATQPYRALTLTFHAPNAEWVEVYVDDSLVDVVPPRFEGAKIGGWAMCSASSFDVSGAKSVWLVSVDAWGRRSSAVRVPVPTTPADDVR